MPVSRGRTLALVLLLDGLQRRRRGRRSRFWVHPLNQQRRQQGDFYHLVAELRLDSQRHHQYFRMSAEQMDELLSFIGPEVTRRSTNYRAAIEPKQRPAVALSQSTWCALPLRKTMMERFLPRPTQDTWEEVADAVDGKHVTIQAPPQTGSQYFNYMKTFSIVLLALVDSNYKFRVIQVGDFGRTSDGGVYAGSALGRGMETKSLHVPPSTSLPGAAHLGDVPHVMVGDGSVMEQVHHLIRRFCHSKSKRNVLSISEYGRDWHSSCVRSLPMYSKTKSPGSTGCMANTPILYNIIKKTLNSGQSKRDVTGFCKVGLYATLAFSRCITCSQCSALSQL
uniref:DDE Tnp4 domain-containing protein n=1 Tax=Seriola lalandi dorsalis TaxID=1841481 RepID=A0A3B4Y4W8_SERLL